MLEDAALSDLASLDADGSVLRCVLDLFVVDAQRGFGEILEAIGAGDRGRVVAASHQLKSSSGYVGATELAKVCATLEAAAQSSASPLPGLIPELRAAYEAATSAVHALRSGMA